MTKGLRHTKHWDLMYLTTLCPVTPRGAEPGCLMHTPTDGQTHTHRHTLGPMCSRLTCWISFVKLPRRIWISDCHWICIIRKSWRWNTNAPTNSQLHRRSLSPGLAVNQAWIIIRYTGTTGRNNTVAACYIFHPQSGGECCGTRLQTHWKALSYTTGLAASGG